MVISPASRQSRSHGAAMIELTVAIFLLIAVIFPLAYSIASEKRLARASYERAVAMEIVDGEMEVLVAGEWRRFEPGVHPYPARATSATNLPPGHLQLIVRTNRIRLEWLPDAKHHGGPVAREAGIP